MSNQKLNEWQTRKQLIDKEIIKRGWNIKNKNQVEEEYTIDNDLYASPISLNW